MYSKLASYITVFILWLLTIKNRDVLMKIIVMSKFIQSLRPTTYIPYA